MSGVGWQSYEEGGGMSVLGADPLFWFLLLCALTSGLFFVLALDNEDRPLAWSAGVAFVLICLAAVSELLLWGQP